MSTGFSVKETQENLVLRGQRISSDEMISKKKVFTGHLQNTQKLWDWFNWSKQLGQRGVEGEVVA